MTNLQTINPSTGKIIKSYKLLSDADINTVLKKATLEQTKWETTEHKSRAQFFFKLAELLKIDKNKYAASITTEMGKPIVQARAEIEKCAWLCEYYAEFSEQYLQNKIIDTGYKKSYITYKPLGVIVGVMPWNFPFWQVFRFAVPSLMAGNTVIVKHAENCLGTSELIQELFIAAGFPEYIFNNVIIDHDQVNKILSDQRIAGVSLTGSERAGSAIASTAGKYLKKVVLELGGNDPYIILADADLEKAANACLASRLTNTGQVCIAAKRLIVEKQVYNQFKKLILERIKNFKIGDPLDESVKIGPLARADLRDNLHRQVTDSIAAGAVCLVGGKLQSEKESVGNYYPVTVLEKITNTMPAYSEELFGPVICLFEAESADHAIEIANDSKYGLAGAVFTNNIDCGEMIANTRLKVGTAAVNSFVSSDPRLPFGGIKCSGYGRELGEVGIQEFVNIKTIILN
ncbi:MAG: NAD-dependent succinate-semialdehyde dehydrogenase [Gammaproteobacteria bacterium]|nr:NAD-dependent succinate-semialdehyde dehydrogenase [Gammaproteobacteria bacterium]